MLNCKKIRHLAAHAVFSLGFCLMSTACLPHGMPEYFSRAGDLPTGALAGLAREISAKRIHSAPIAIVFIPTLSVSPALEHSSAAREVLGHQYLFALIPVSSLYLQHGAQVLLEETTLDVLAGRGFNVYLAPESKHEAVIRLIRPKRAVRLEFEELSLNAFDAFFFRINSVKGKVVLSEFILEQDFNIALRETREEMSESKISRYGFAPYLQDFLRRNTALTVEKMLGFGPNSRIGKQKTIDREGEKQFSTSSAFLILKPPVWESSAVDGIKHHVADSYGFPGQPPFSEKQLSRLLQRGMFSAADDLGFVPLQSVFVEGAQEEISGSWSLFLRVLSAGEVPREASDGDVQPGIRLKAALSLREHIEQGEVELRSCICETEGSAPPVLDGWGAAALEELGRAIIQTALGEKKLKDVRCRCS